MVGMQLEVQIVGRGALDAGRPCCRGESSSRGTEAAGHKNLPAAGWASLFGTGFGERIVCGDAGGIVGSTAVGDGIDGAAANADAASDRTIREPTGLRFARRQQPPHFRDNKGIDQPKKLRILVIRASAGGILAQAGYFWRDWL